MAFSRHATKRKGEITYPFPWCFDNILLRFAAIVAVGRFRYAVVNDSQSCIACPFQSGNEGLFFTGGEGGKHPVCQIKIGIRLCADTDLYTGECLTADFTDNGLYAVVTAGRTVSPDTKPSRFQRNIIKHDDDPLGRDIEIGAELQHRTAGQVHKCLGFQQKQLFTLIVYLIVEPLILQFVHFAA